MMLALSPSMGNRLVTGLFDRVNHKKPTMKQLSRFVWSVSFVPLLA